MIEDRSELPKKYPLLDPKKEHVFVQGYKKPKQIYRALGNSPSAIWMVRGGLFFHRKASVEYISKERFVDTLKTHNPDDFIWIMFHPEILESYYHEC